MSDTKRLEKSNFNMSNPLIMYLHGFSERAPGGSGQSSQEIRDGKLILYILLQKKYSIININHCFI